MEGLVCKETVLPRWPGTKWNASEGIWRVSLGPRPFTVIIWPFSTRLIPSFDAVSFILSLFRNDYSSPILLQWGDVKNWNETRICHLHFGTAIGRTWKVCEQLGLFLWDTLNGMELNLLIWSCCGCRCAHMQKHFVMLYLFSVVQRSLRRHGASYILFFVVDIFSVRKCSLKVWGSKQLLSWVAEQCFGHELVIHCKWFLQLFRIGFAVSVKVHDRYIDPHSTNQMLLSV